MALAANEVLPLDATAVVVWQLNKVFPDIQQCLRSSSIATREQNNWTTKADAHFLSHPSSTATLSFANTS